MPQLRVVQLPTAVTLQSEGGATVGEEVEWSQGESEVLVCLVRGGEWVSW